MKMRLFITGLLLLSGIRLSAQEMTKYGIKSAVIKYSLSLVHKDTHIVLSKQKDRAGLIGACMVARKNALHE